MLLGLLSLFSFEVNGFHTFGSFDVDHPEQGLITFFSFILIINNLFMQSRYLVDALFKVHIFFKMLFSLIYNLLFEKPIFVLNHLYQSFFFLDPGHLLKSKPLFYLVFQSDDFSQLMFLIVGVLLLVMFNIPYNLLNMYCILLEILVNFFVEIVQFCIGFMNLVVNPCKSEELFLLNIVVHLIEIRDDALSPRFKLIALVACLGAILF